MGLSLVKELTDEVTVYDTNGRTIKQLTEDAALFLTERHRAGGILIVDERGQHFDLDIAQLVDTQVLPAAAVPFTGNAAGLYELLTLDFFNNVVRPTGGPTVQDNIVSIIGASYLATEDNYILIAKADTTITLPTAPQVGFTLKIKSVNKKVTINTGGSDLLDGLTSAKIHGYTAIELRYYATNNWGVF